MAHVGSSLACYAVTLAKATHFINLLEWALSRTPLRSRSPFLKPHQSQKYKCQSCKLYSSNTRRKCKAEFPREEFARTGKTSHHLFQKSCRCCKDFRSLKESPGWTAGAVLQIADRVGSMRKTFDQCAFYPLRVNRKIRFSSESFLDFENQTHWP